MCSLSIASLSRHVADQLSEAENHPGSEAR